MTRFERIIQSVPDVQDRLAIAAAIFHAQGSQEAFTAKYGTYGWECLTRLMAAEKEPPNSL